jgi:alpha-tubulin suppressor-like RCC1 family protein
MSIIQVSYGAYHLAILLENGKVLTCGSNQQGQLGRITQTEINNPNFDYIDDTNFKNLKVVKIASGWFHMLILLENGKVLSCGSNRIGELGRNYTDVTSIFNYVDDKNFRDIRVVDVICGPYNSAIILENGKCLTCGGNYTGQLGHSEISIKPTIFNYIENFDPSYSHIKSIVLEKTHSVLLLDNGKVFTCGSNQYGKLGIDIPGNSNISVFHKVTETNFQNNKVVKIACGSSHTAILLENGDVLTCGLNTQGQLGREENYKTQRISKLFTKINININIINLYCSWNNTFILTKDNNILFCGADTNNEYLFKIFDEKLKNKLNGVANIIDISLSLSHMAVLLDNGKVLTRGSNHNGQLGRHINNVDDSILNYLDDTLLPPKSNSSDELVNSQIQDQIKRLNVLPILEEVLEEKQLPILEEVLEEKQLPILEEVLEEVLLEKCQRKQITPNIEFSQKFNDCNKYIQLTILKQYIDLHIKNFGRITNEYLTTGLNVYNVEIPSSIDAYIRINNRIICLIYDWNKDNSQNNTQDISFKINEYDNFINEIIISDEFNKLPNKNNFERSCILITNNHFDEESKQILYSSNINVIIEYNDVLEIFLTDIIQQLELTDINMYIQNTNWNYLRRLYTPFDKDLISTTIFLILKDLNFENTILYKPDDIKELIISPSKYTNDIIVICNEYEYSYGSCGSKCVEKILELSKNKFFQPSKNYIWFILTQTEIAKVNKNKLDRYNKNMQYYNIFNISNSGIIDTLLLNDTFKNYKLKQKTHRDLLEIHKKELHLKEQNITEEYKAQYEYEKNNLEVQNIENLDIILQDMPEEIKQEIIDVNLVNLENAKTFLEQKYVNSYEETLKENEKTQLVKLDEDKKIVEKMEIIKKDEITISKKKQGRKFKDKLQETLQQFHNWDINMRSQDIRKHFEEPHLYGIDHVLIDDIYMILITDKIYKTTVGQETIDHFLKATEKIFDNKMVKNKNYKFLCINLSLNGFSQPAQSNFKYENDKYKKYIRYYYIHDISEDILIKKTIDLIKSFPKILERDVNPFDSNILNRLKTKLNSNFEIDDLSGNILICKKHNYNIYIKNEWHKKEINVEKIEDFIKYVEDKMSIDGNKNLYLFILITKDEIKSNIMEIQNDKYIFDRFYNCYGNELELPDLILDKILEYPDKCKDVISDITKL